MNYFIYPLKNMRITQSYTSTYSHRPHWYNSKNYKDYPIDDGGKDGGREGIYCPCDEMVVTAIKGIGNSKITNTIWLVSTSKVYTPTFNDYAFMTLTHSNDSDFKNIKVGTKFKRGQLIVHEGENVGVATHIHMTFGRGSSNNWITNSNGKTVIKGDTKKPEEVCYVDTNFTVIHSSGGIKWITKPVAVGNPIPRNENNNQIEILVSNLRARKEPSISNNIVGYIKKGIYNITEVSKKSDYVWYKIGEYWIAYSSEWAKLYNKITLDTDKKPQKEDSNNNQDKGENNEKVNKYNIFTIIFKLLKKLMTFLQQIIK